MRQIDLGQGQFTTVTNSDYVRLSKETWTARRAPNGRKYAVRYEAKNNGKTVVRFMHREIMNCPPGMDVDHKDRNGLNNCKRNLRICSRSKNMGNAKLYRTNKSGFKGVSWNRINRRWKAQMGIQIAGQETSLYLGYFQNPAKAARVYDEAAKQYFGPEFARTNFKLGLFKRK